MSHRIRLSMKRAGRNGRPDGVHAWNSIVIVVIIVPTFRQPGLLK
jgi:hypothetical protein